MDMAFLHARSAAVGIFHFLPSPVRAALLRHEVYVSSLGELQTMAEHFRHELEL